jgi:hypothetical protein
MDFIHMHECGCFITLDLFLEISARRGRWKSSFHSFFNPNLKEKKNDVENTHTHTYKYKSISEYVSFNTKHIKRIYHLANHMQI